MNNGLTFIMIVNLIIWLGLALYLFHIDRQIKRLEKDIRNQRKTK